MKVITSDCYSKQKACISEKTDKIHKERPKQKSKVTARHIKKLIDATKSIFNTLQRAMNKHITLKNIDERNRFTCALFETLIGENPENILIHKKIIYTKSQEHELTFPEIIKLLEKEHERLKSMVKN